MFFFVLMCRIWSLMFLFLIFIFVLELISPFLSRLLEDSPTPLRLCFRFVCFLFDLSWEYFFPKRQIFLSCFWFKCGKLSAVLVRLSLGSPNLTDFRCCNIILLLLFWYYTIKITNNLFSLIIINLFQFCPQIRTKAPEKRSTVWC